MEQILDKKQAIFDATLRLISENGFHGTAMSKVAKEANVSTGIIYHYFESKDELIAELYSHLKNKMGHHLMQQSDPNQPIVTQIRQFIHDAISYTIWHPHESAFIEQFDRSPYQQDRSDSVINDYYKMMMALFEKAKQDQIIKDLPIYVIYLFTIGIATSLGHQQVIGQSKLNDQLISQVVETAWQAIRN